MFGKNTSARIDSLRRQLEDLHRVVNGDWSAFVAFKAEVNERLNRLSEPFVKFTDAELDEIFSDTEDAVSVDKLFKDAQTKAQASKAQAKKKKKPAKKKPKRK